MGWIFGRHCFYARSGDFSSLISLTHLCGLILTGYGILSKTQMTNGPFKQLWIICISSIFFLFSLICTKKIAEPIGKPSILTYILLPLISLSIATLIAQMHFHNALRSLALHLILISFSLTGFPSLVIILTVSIGIAIGITAQIHMKHSWEFKLIMMDLTLMLWQSIAGMLMYKRFEKLALMIVSIKKKPLACVNNYQPVECVESEIMSVLDRDEMIDLFAKSYSSYRQASLTAKSARSFIPPSRMDSRMVETVITSCSYRLSSSYRSEFSPPALQKSNYTSSRFSEIPLLSDNDTFLNEFKMFEYELVSPILRNILTKLPICMKKLFGMAVFYVKYCYSLRDIFLKATWINEDFLPPRNLLGMFSCEIFEDWYIEWMHKFNVKLYIDSAWILLLYCYHGTISSAIAAYKHYISITSQVETSRYVFLIIRFVSQPVAVTLVLLPLLIDRYKGRTRKARCYYLLSLLLCLIQFVYTMFDVSWVLTWEHPGEISYNSHSVEMLLMHTCIILLCRYPTYFATFIIYSLSFIILHLALSSDPRIRIISAESAPQVVVAIGSFFFYIRPLDISRRMLFCRYVLPYLLHLKSMYAEKHGTLDDTKIDAIKSIMSL